MTKKKPESNRFGLTRRQVLAAGAGAAAVPALVAAQSAPATPLAAPGIPNVRIGFVGVGGMGTVHVRNLLAVEKASPGVEIRAVCDIRPEHAERARDFIREAGGPKPALYTRGDRDFERMCAEEDLDLVFTAGARHICEMRVTRRRVAPRSRRSGWIGWRIGGR